MKKLLLTGIIAIQASIGFSQTSQLKKSNSNKGKIFVSWGWNKGAFTHSNIHFKGNDYNFTLKGSSQKTARQRSPCGISILRKLQFRSIISELAIILIPSTVYRLASTT